MGCFLSTTRFCIHYDGQNLYLCECLIDNWSYNYYNPYPFINNKELITLKSSFFGYYNLPKKFNINLVNDINIGIIKEEKLKEILMKNDFDIDFINKLIFDMKSVLYENSLLN